jgi:decaprenylphospho-beta-D-ribofuranose 2-oxidase
LNYLDDEVIANEGRIYLAKDSFLNPKKFTLMYPNSEEFRRLRAAYGFTNFIESDLSRRISI